MLVAGHSGGKYFLFSLPNPKNSKRLRSTPVTGVLVARYLCRHTLPEPLSPEGTFHQVRTLVICTKYCSPCKAQACEEFLLPHRAFTVCCASSPPPSPRGPAQPCTRTVHYIKARPPLLTSRLLAQRLSLETTAQTTTRSLTIPSAISNTSLFLVEAKTKPDFRHLAYA